MSFESVIEKYRNQSNSKRDQGARFERLMQAYLLTDPQYTNILSKVWLWDEFHGKVDLGGGDTGIDLVGLTHDGKFWAIQCKCYHESTVMDKASVDSFLATSSRTFRWDNTTMVGFSQRIWISTTNKWGKNAQEALERQQPAVTRINLADLKQAPVDWEKLEAGLHGKLGRTPKKALRPHQQEALTRTHEYFKTQNRGKLIMACGTGKTFTALKIAEHETGGRGLVLFLVPSMALLGQTLREWSADIEDTINPICICSDPSISRKKTRHDDHDYFSVMDLALPASTDPEVILTQFKQFQKLQTGMTVVFSTYQSIDVVAKAQEHYINNGGKPFDLIICDEAHRTTGIALAGEDESAFTKVHDNNIVQGEKRLYMTATPRLYDQMSKSKAAEADAFLWSMDDPYIYGEEIYRIGFGEAVDKGLLTDYKVLILTLNDADVPTAIRNILSSDKKEISADDATKIVGSINALSKQFLGDSGETKNVDPNPMKRAVAFCPRIRASK
jgi:predicted helicase